MIDKVLDRLWIGGVDLVFTVILAADAAAERAWNLVRCTRKSSSMRGTGE